jgi:hypothetical protein
MYRLIAWCWQSASIFAQWLVAHPSPPPGETVWAVSEWLLTAKL